MAQPGSLLGHQCIQCTRRRSLVHLNCTNAHLAQRCSWDVTAQLESIGSRTRYRLLDGVRPHSASCLAVSEISRLRNNKLSP